MSKADQMIEKGVHKALEMEREESLSIRLDYDEEDLLLPHENEAESLAEEKDKRPKILLLNGPNLNMLGKRPARHYGTFTLAEAVDRAREAAEQAGYRLLHEQSNYEGRLIEAIHEAVEDGTAAILINAGALTHYSYALADALEIFGGIKIEVHISDIQQRENFRRRSVLRAQCDDEVSGLGIESYTEAVRRALRLLEHHGTGAGDEGETE